MSYTAGSVMDMAASLMNDTAKSLYTYAVQLPYLKMAQQDLEQALDLNEVPLNLISEYESTVAAGAIALSLPTSFFLPISLKERQSGSTLESDYSDMREVPNVKDLSIVAGPTLVYWDYRHNCINFVGATANRQVRLYYWRILTEIANENSLEPVIGANNYLAFRTAGLLSRYIGGPPAAARTQGLDIDTNIALDRLVSLLVKNNQGKRVRRKPFRTGRRNGYYVRIP